MAATWPSRIDYDTAPYWRGLAESRLLIARCLDCSNWIHPPRACCPACWSDNVGHQVPSGRATLYSYVTQRPHPGAPLQIIAWAELIEQERLLVVAELKHVAPESVRIGADLILDWDIVEDRSLPFFREVPQP